jgi:hypothetical protein
MASRETLEDHLRAACEVHGKQFSDVLVTGWMGCTKSVSDTQLKECWWDICSDKVPKPSDLLNAVAGVNPHDEWGVIMGVAQGLYETGQINGFAAASLRRIGGVRAVSMASTEGKEGWSELDRLKKEFLDGLQTGGSGLPPAPEIISLSGSSTTGQQLPGGTYIDSTGAVCRNDYCDATGKDRADSLCRLLLSGEIKPSTVRLILKGKSGAPGGRLPAAQRDRVLAAIGEVEINNYKEKYHEQSIQKNGQRRIGQYR